MPAADLAVRSGTDAEVITICPVIQVVLTAPAFAGVGGNFVLAEARFGHARDAGFLHVPGIIHFRNAGWRFGREQGVRFQRELIMRQMLRIQREGLLDIIQCHGQGLLGQGIHQIQIDVAETGVLSADHRRPSPLGVMDSAQALKAAIIETLHAETQAVHAGREITGEAVVFGGTGVAFQGDFAIRREAQPRIGHAQDLADGGAGKQAGRTAAEKHATDTATPNQRQVLLQIAGERRDVISYRQFTFMPMRVEIAVRAFLHAPRNMDVQRQRRRHQLRHVWPGAPAAQPVRGRGG